MAVDSWPCHSPSKVLGYTDHVGLELRPKTTELAAVIGVNKAN